APMPPLFPYTTLFRSLRDWQAANSAVLQASGMTPERMQMFEPWFVGLMISMTEMTKQGLDPKLGLDQHFIEAAEIAGKRTGGLRSEEHTSELQSRENL